MILQRAGKIAAALVRRFEHHEGLRLDQLLVVGPADDGGFQHVGMALQRAFDLERRHVHAGDFQHVVAPAAVDEIAVVVLDIFVAGARPFAENVARDCSRLFQYIIALVGPRTCNSPISPRCLITLPSSSIRRRS